MALQDVVHRSPVGATAPRRMAVSPEGRRRRVDNSEEFTYTGSGGRDLSGNKRTNDQGFQQTLTWDNAAIAENSRTATPSSTTRKEATGRNCFLF